MRRRYANFRDAVLAEIQSHVIRVVEDRQSFRRLAELRKDIRDGLALGRSALGESGFGVCERTEMAFLQGGLVDGDADAVLFDGQVFREIVILLDSQTVVIVKCGHRLG